MPGLQLGMMGGVQSSVTTGTTTTPTAVSAGQAAYGPGYTAGGTPSRAAALAPNDPFGAAFWTGCIALGLLLLIRHSLPA